MIFERGLQSLGAQADSRQKKPIKMKKGFDRSWAIM
jgi:hypothetical protein